MVSKKEQALIGLEERNKMQAVTSCVPHPPVSSGNSGPQARSLTLQHATPPPPAPPPRTHGPPQRAPTAHTKKTCWLRD